MNNSELPPHEVSITIKDEHMIVSRDIDIQNLNYNDRFDLTKSLVHNPKITSIVIQGSGSAHVFDRNKITDQTTPKERAQILMTTFEAINISLPQAATLSVIEKPTPLKNTIGVLLKNPSAFEALRLIYSHAPDKDTELVRVIADPESGRIIEKGTIKPYQMVRNESVEDIENFANSFEGHSDEVAVFMHVQKPIPKDQK